MPRVKGGSVTRQRRKKVIKLAKGYYGAKHILFKVANHQVMKSGNYAYRDRRNKKRTWRALWIQRINAAAREHGLVYSEFMHGLIKAGVTLDRKVLADIAVNDAAMFKQLAAQAQAAIKA